MYEHKDKSLYLISFKPLLQLWKIQGHFLDVNAIFMDYI